MGVGGLPEPRKSAADTKGWFDINVEIPCAKFWWKKLVAAAHFVLFVSIACEPEKTSKAVADLGYEAGRAIGEAFGYDVRRARKGTRDRVVGAYDADSARGRSAQWLGRGLRDGLGNKLISNDPCAVTAESLQ